MDRQQTKENHDMQIPNGTGPGEVMATSAEAFGNAPSVSEHSTSKQNTKDLAGNGEILLENLPGKFAEIIRTLHHGDILFAAMNDRDALTLLNLGHKAINITTVGIAPVLRTAEVLVIANHDICSRQAAFYWARQLSETDDNIYDPQNVEAIDPFSGNEVLPFNNGKGLQDLVDEWKSNILGVDPEFPLNDYVDEHLYGGCFWSLRRFSEKEIEQQRSQLDLRPIGKSRKRSNIRTYAWHYTIPRGGLTVLSGSPKAGKTTTAEGLAVAVSRGEPFLGRATTKGRVLYFAFEGQREQIEERIEQMGGGPEIMVHGNLAPRSVDDTIKLLTEAIVITDPVLVIIDTLGKMLPEVSDINGNYMQVGRDLERYIDLVKRTNVGLLVLHHDNARQELLGTQAIKGSADSVLHQRRDIRTDQRTLEGSEYRFGQALPPTIVALNESGRLVAGVSKSDLLSQEIESVILSLITDLGPTKRQDIIDALAKKWKNGIVGKALKSMVKKKSLGIAGLGVKGSPHIYSIP